ncbi:exopolysaccharide biosynthesis polyprenyl glycosylphosphotransferase, partial [bacterium]
LYAKTTAQSIETVYAKTWRTIAIHLLLCCGYLLIDHELLLKNFLTTILVLELVGFVSSRFVVTAFDQYNNRMTRYKKNIMVLGYNETAIKLANYFQQNKMSYHFAGFVQYDNEEFPKHLPNEYCSIPGFSDFVTAHDVREVYSTVFPNTENAQLQAVIDVAEQNCIRVKFVADKKQPIDSNLYLENYIDNMPIINFRTEPLEIFKNQFLKRVFDICFSLCVFIFIYTWLIPIISILIKLDSKGPVFFLQNRAGKDNKPFKIYKFRTMLVTEADGEYKQATKNDSRITKIGVFLRKTSLDEVPQFLNVLIGNMSIVGPRPHMLKHTEQYRAIIDKYMVRHFLKPGITGWAQVNG